MYEGPHTFIILLTAAFQL